MNKIRLGIVGAGIIVRKAHLPALAALRDFFEVVAVCSRGRTSAEQVAVTVGGDVTVCADAEELVSRTDVDAVDIATPITMNAPLAILAAQAGKHIFLEKPIAATVEQGAVVAALPDCHRIVLLVAETRRYQPVDGIARRLLTEGAVGEPILLQWERLTRMRPDNPYVRTPWRRYPAHIGGYLSDSGVHAIASLHTLGGPISQIHALTTSFCPDEFGPIDTLLLNLAFASGLIGHVAFSVGAPEQESRALLLYGTEGRLALTPSLITVKSSRGERSIPVPPVDPFQAAFKDFHRAIVTGDSPLGTAVAALADLQVIGAALRSAASACVVAVSNDAGPGYTLEC